MLGRERLRLMLFRRFRDGLVPPQVASLGPGDVGVGALDDQNVPDGGGSVHGFVDGVLDGGGLAASPLAVGGDDEFGFGVVDARAQCGGGEPGEDDRMGQAEACTGEDRDDGLGDHRHVDRDAVAGDEAEFGQGVGGLADVGEQIGVGDVAAVAGFTFPVDGDLVAVAVEDVAVDAVVGDVELAVGEPFRDGGVGPVEYLGERGVPVQPAGLLRPEREPVLLRGGVQICLSVRLRRELGRGCVGGNRGLVAAGGTGRHLE